MNDFKELPKTKNALVHLGIWKFLVAYIGDKAMSF